MGKTFRLVAVMAAALFIAQAALAVSFTIQGSNDGISQSSSTTGGLCAGSSFSGTDSFSFDSGLSLIKSATASMLDGSELANEWRADDPTGKYSAASGYYLDSADRVSITGGSAIEAKTGYTWEKGSIVNGVNPHFYSIATNSKQYTANVYIDSPPGGSTVTMSYSGSAKANKDMVAASQVATGISGNIVLTDQAGFSSASVGGGPSYTLDAHDTMTVEDGFVKSVSSSARADPTRGASTSIGKALVTYAGLFETSEQAIFGQAGSTTYTSRQTQTNKRVVDGTGIVYSGSSKATVRDCISSDSVTFKTASLAEKDAMALYNQRIIESYGYAGLVPKTTTVLPDIDSVIVVSGTFGDTAVSRSDQVSMSEKFTAKGLYIERGIRTLVPDDPSPGQVAVQTWLGVGGGAALSSVSGSSYLSFNAKGAALSGSWSGKAAAGGSYMRSTEARYLVSVDASGKETWRSAFISSGWPDSFKIYDYAYATRDGKTLKVS